MTKQISLFPDHSVGPAEFYRVERRHQAYRRVDVFYLVVRKGEAKVIEGIAPNGEISDDDWQPLLDRIIQYADEPDRPEQIEVQWESPYGLQYKARKIRAQTYRNARHDARFQNLQTY